MLAGADLWGWMALVRARNIKPGLFKNDLLAETGLAGRVLFIGLWCMADREGRLEDRPRRIKAEVLPFDNCDVEDLLSQLEERDFLVRYEVNGQRFIQIANFVKHQRPHHKEVASEIPPPPGHVDSGVIPGGPTEEQRLRIFERDGWRCLECGSTEDLHIDHIIPRAKGGGHEDSNLQTLCRRCNLAKSDRMVEPTTDQVQPKLDPSMGQPRVIAWLNQPRIKYSPSLIQAWDKNKPSMDQADRLLIH